MLLKAAFPLIGIFVLTSKTAPYYTPSRLFATAETTRRTVPKRIKYI
jgi:hypothetical protein